MQVESRIEQVMLYARGALVRRVTAIPFGSASMSGSPRVRIVGLPAAVIDDTVRASLAPPLGRRAVTLEYRVKSQRGVAGV
jgi:hypothetical protein